MPDFKFVTKNEIYVHSIAAKPSEVCSILATLSKQDIQEFYTMLNYFLHQDQLDYEIPTSVKH